MSDDNGNTSDNELRVRVPTTLSIRDVVYIIIAIVTVTTTFMMYGTRLSIVEEKVLSIGNHLTEIKTTIKEIKREQQDARKGLTGELNLIEGRLRALEEQRARLEGLIQGGHLGHNTDDKKGR